ncbi:hypothetical protein [Rubritalea marina]|uniref:hypothetical protein n=1 Tax=Rubritalea marina TaxID=361055 RepID=UPI0003781DD6|nr:hypothetical protein [Rubritalea marina]
MNLVGLVCGVAWMPLAATEFDLGPIYYTDSEDHNKVHDLERDLPKLFSENDPEKCLELLLAHLGISEHSQVLVFSKSSEQNSLISPKTPRAIYHSEDYYVGYVAGGMIELIAADDPVGMKFYTFDPRAPEGERKVTRDNTCLRCHATARTREVPGVLVRSLSTQKDGHLEIFGDTYLTRPSSPIEERWGGWYVTGRHGDVPHLGNQFSDGDRDAEKVMNLQSLDGLVDLSNYAQKTSDIVSLMVMEHQVDVHNLLSWVRMEYERAKFLALAFDPERDLSQSALLQRLEQDFSEKLLKALCFDGEAKLPADGIDGCDAFAQSFEARGPRSKEGWSLYDLRLQKRLFKYRCSYMVYSKGFEFLPPEIKSRTLNLLHQHLTADAFDGLPKMSKRERERVHAILSQTHPDYAKLSASASVY